MNKGQGYLTIMDNKTLTGLYIDENHLTSSNTQRKIKEEFLKQNLSSKNTHDNVFSVGKYSNSNRGVNYYRALFQKRCKRYLTA